MIFSDILIIKCQRSDFIAIILSIINKTYYYFDIFSIIYQTFYSFFDEKELFEHFKQHKIANTARADFIDVILCITNKIK